MIFQCYVWLPEGNSKQFFGAKTAANSVDTWETARCCKWFSHVVTTCVRNRLLMLVNVRECCWNYWIWYCLPLLLLQLDSLPEELSLSWHRMFQLITTYPTSMFDGILDQLVVRPSPSVQQSPQRLENPLQNLLNLVAHEVDHNSLFGGLQVTLW